MTLGQRLRRYGAFAIFALLLAGPADAIPDAAPNGEAPSLTLSELNGQLSVGDVVFIRVGALPFDKISQATQSWVNHVGIVVDISGDQAVIAESAFPLSRRTRLEKFVRRSRQQQVAVARLAIPLSDEQRSAVVAASKARLGVLYDTGFNIESERQYCSRFVHEVLDQATGVRVGDVESFRALLARHPETGLGFWQLWFFGRIPWDRQTVTPASLYRSEALHQVFEGRVDLDESPAWGRASHRKAAGMTLFP